MPRSKSKRNSLNVVYRKVTDLVPYENNAKVHEDYDVGVIAQNIKDFGFKVPFVITADNVIVAGHGRRLALISLGRQDQEFPCVLVDDLTPAQIDLFRLSDNMSSEKAGYDYEIFDAQIQRLQQMEDLPALDLLGFQVADGKDDDDDETDDDDDAQAAVADEPEPVEGDEPVKKGRTVTCPCCGAEFEI